MSYYLSDYQPPTEQQRQQLAAIELLYKQIEVELLKLPNDSIREQALFRLRESEGWAREGIKRESEARPPQKTKGGSYII